MTDLAYIYQDPRPDLPDSPQWTLLLWSIAKQIDDNETGLLLQKRLWTLRSIGARLEGSPRNGYRIVPMYESSGGGWVDEAHWSEMRARYIHPYGKEIIKILEVLERAAETQKSNQRPTSGAGARRAQR
jgi:hypothetical protein